MDWHTLKSCIFVGMMLVEIAREKVTIARFEKNSTPFVAATTKS